VVSAAVYRRVMRLIEEQDKQKIRINFLFSCQLNTLLTYVHLVGTKKELAARMHGVGSFKIIKF
jgi:hypothetical protein